MRICLASALALSVWLAVAAGWSVAQEQLPAPANQRLELVELRQLPLREALRALSLQTNLNLVASAAAAEVPVTLYLQNVTPRAALEALTKSHGLFYREDTETGIITLYTNGELQSIRRFASSRCCIPMPTTRPKRSARCLASAWCSAWDPTHNRSSLIWPSDSIALTWSISACRAWVCSAADREWVAADSAVAVLAADSEEALAADSAEVATWDSTELAAAAVEVSPGNAARTCCRTQLPIGKWPRIRPRCR